MNFFKSITQSSTLLFFAFALASSSSFAQSKVNLELRSGATVIDYGLFNMHPRLGFALLISPIENFRGGISFNFDSSMNSKKELKEANTSLFGIHHFALENQFKVYQNLWLGFNVGFFSLFRTNADGNEQLIFGDRFVAFESSIRYDFQFEHFYAAPQLSAMFQGGRERPIVYAELVLGKTF